MMEALFKGKKPDVFSKKIFQKFFLYPVVVTSFSHWRSGGGKQTASPYPSYVLAVHSSRAVMIEQFPMTEFLLADAVTWMTVKNGKVHTVGTNFMKSAFQFG